jgi:putative DNA primase/helicase
MIPSQEPKSESKVGDPATNGQLSGADIRKEILPGPNAPDLPPKPKPKVIPSPRAPYKVAKLIVDCYRQGNNPLRYWDRLWFIWEHTQYLQIEIEDIRDDLYHYLGDVKYQGAGAKSQLLDWNPTPAKLNQVIDAARGLVRLPEGFKVPGWLDGRTETVIPCRNGLVRFNGELLKHTSDYFNVMALPLDYVPGLPIPPEWLTFLDQVLADQESIDELQKWFAYVLTGRTDWEQLLLLLGPSRSGKGTIAHVLQALVGFAHGAAALSGKQFQGSTFAYEPLIGKTLGILSDERVTFGKELVEALLKITGRDMLSINRKNKKGVSDFIRARIMFLTNKVPNFPDDAGAIKERCIVLHTPNQFNGRDGNPEADLKLKDDLASKHLPGILQWALSAMPKLDTKLKQPAVSAKFLDAIGDIGSPITLFVKEFFDLGNDEKLGSEDERYWVAKADAYVCWKYWCDANGYQPGSEGTLKSKLIEVMQTLGPRVNFEWKDKKRGPAGAQRPAYIGLRLNVDGEKLLGAATGGGSLTIKINDG